MKAVVVHSGGMDSSLCLAAAVCKYGADKVLSLSFDYHQRHQAELIAADKICREWRVAHVVLSIDCLQKITRNALTDSSLTINIQDGMPSTLVVGRNGLMARLAAVHADNLGANKIYMGVIEVESANSGYRDCTRAYMDKMQDILRIDLDTPHFVIETPLVYMTKVETMQFGYKLGVLEFLLENSITCYQGIAKAGCRECPACELRNEGVQLFLDEHPSVKLSFQP